jgi:hypothetical protein
MAVQVPHQLTYLCQHFKTCSCNLCKAWQWLGMQHCTPIKDAAKGHRKAITITITIITIILTQAV